MPGRPAVAVFFALLAASRGARADSCGRDHEGFGPWLIDFKKQAVEQGVSARTVALSLGGATYDPEVIRLDRSQKPFKLTFEKFFAQRVTEAKRRLGQRLIQQHADDLARIEQRYGVPAPVLVAIWGLETDYGVNVGERPVFRSLATLAYDCRRAERFRGELMSALRIVDRGDISPGDMHGAWAGELGQTQFLASSYERFAVDFDEDGRADLIRSAPDVLASTAHYLAGNGWRAGGSWQPGTANFEVIATWNRSAVYQKTIAKFAAQLAR